MPEPIGRPGFDHAAGTCRHDTPPRRPAVALRSLTLEATATSAAHESVTRRRPPGLRARGPPGRRPRTYLPPLPGSTIRASASGRFSFPLTAARQLRSFTGFPDASHGARDGRGTSLTSGCIRLSMGWPFMVRADPGDRWRSGGTVRECTETRVKTALAAPACSLPCGASCARRAGERSHGAFDWNQKPLPPLVLPMRSCPDL
jgi:hypothetical protein